MKKILGISLLAIFAVVPLMAFGEGEEPQQQQPETPAVVYPAVPTHPHNDKTDTGVSTMAATEAPMYQLAQQADSDSSVATAGYVKGAYNATMRAINAIPGSVVETINNAKVDGWATVDLSGVSVTGGTIDLSGADYNPGTVTVNEATSGTVATVTQWGVDEVNGTAPVIIASTEQTKNVTGASLSNVSVGGNMALSGNAPVDISNLGLYAEQYYHHPGAPTKKQATTAPAPVVEEPVVSQPTSEQLAAACADAGGAWSQEYNDCVINLSEAECTGNDKEWKTEYCSLYAPVLPPEPVSGNSDEQQP